MIWVWFGIGLGESGVGVDVWSGCCKIDRPPIAQSRPLIEQIEDRGSLDPLARRRRRLLFCDVEGLRQ